MAQQDDKGLMSKPLPKGSNKVRGKETVTVYSTDADKHNVTGAAMEVHPLLAEKLIAMGRAVKTEAELKSKGGK